MRMLRPLALAAAMSASLVACKSDEQHLDVTVDWDDTKQTMDGFGASSAFFGDTISNDVADQLFDAKKGIGLSLLRIIANLPDDVKSDGSQPTEGAKTVATSPNLATAQQAVERGAKVWATAWTPPPIWKTTNNKNGSGDGFKTNTLKPEHYRDYANYLADFVDRMKKDQVELVAFSPMNEPDYIATWDNAQLTPDELATFIGEHMGPVFEERCPTVKIVAPDTASWPNVDKYFTAILAKANKYVPIIATHPYTNSNASIDLHYNKPQQNGKQFWETEWSQENMRGDTPDPTMTSAIDMMRKMHDHLTLANMSAWNWWAIYISPDALRSADPDKVRQNPALIQPDKNMDKSYMFKRGYSFGHWSKFVRPGFRRVDATDHPTSGVLIEAYRDEAKSRIVLTAINTRSNPVTQNFISQGGSFGTLTPWVTSPNDELSAKSTIDGGDAFTFDLPAQSVVTFINWDATKETPNQGSLPIINRPDGGTPTTGGLDCANAIVPSNMGEGGVTDFSDWKDSKWGDPTGLWGYRYGYQGPKGSTITVGVDAEAKHMKVTGSVTSGDYGGAGLSFMSCTTVKSFSKLQFTVAGSSPGCDLELQVKTFDQTPIDQNPAGGCFQDASAGCYNYPAAKQVAVPTSEPATVEVPLTDVSNWSDDIAGQVVGLQWQWTGNAELDPDSGVGCPIDVTITNIKFVP